MAVRQFFGFEFRRQAQTTGADPDRLSFLHAVRAVRRKLNSLRLRPRQFASPQVDIRKATRLLK